MPPGLIRAHLRASPLRVFLTSASVCLALEDLPSLLLIACEKR